MSSDRILDLAADLDLNMVYVPFVGEDGMKIKLVKNPFKGCEVLLSNFRNEDVEGSEHSEVLFDWKLLQPPTRKNYDKKALEDLVHLIGLQLIARTMYSADRILTRMQLNQGKPKLIIP